MNSRSSVGWEDSRTGPPTVFRKRGGDSLSVCGAYVFHRWRAESLPVNPLWVPLLERASFLCWERGFCQTGWFPAGAESLRTCHPRSTLKNPTHPVGAQLFRDVSTVCLSLINWLSFTFFWMLRPCQSSMRFLLLTSKSTLRASTLLSPEKRVARLADP